jgi:hypothetical protein
MVIVFVDTPQPITTDALAKALTLQIFRNRRKLLQRRFQFFSDFQRQHVRIRQIRAVFERFVPKPENISIDLVSLEQVALGEAFASDLRSVRSGSRSPEGNCDLARKTIALVAQD